MNVASVASVSAGGPLRTAVSAGSSIVNVWLAGVASGCSAGSIERTRKVCSPGPSSLPVYSTGGSQPSNGSPSIEHSNAARLSLAVKLNR